MPRHVVSVVLPTLNPGPEFPRVIAGLTGQVDVGVELIVVDSGSPPPVLDVARERGARIHRIPPGQFSHSGARNLGASHASGDLLLFTVQDAQPSGPTWLRHLADALDRLDAVALSCRESPRPDADVLYRTMAWAHTRFLSPAGEDVVMQTPADPSPEALRRNGQLSDVACLIRRGVFDRYQYRGDYAEDLDLGLRLIAAAHRLAFLTSEYVAHSHNRPASYHLRRGYVDHLALLRILPGYPSAAPSWPAVLGDVLASFAVTDAIARAGGTTGCTLHAWSDAVEGSFAAARAGAVPTVQLESHAYVDAETVALLRSVVSDGRQCVDARSDDGTLLHAVPQFIGLMLTFLEQDAEPFDAYVAEEFKRALYKAWAFQTGVHLAACAGRYSDELPATLRDLQARLVAGV